MLHDILPTQRPRSLTCASTAARLLGLRVRFPTENECLSTVSVVLPGRDLYNEPITHPEESYRVCGVTVKPRKGGGVGRVVAVELL